MRRHSWLKYPVYKPSSARRVERATMRQAQQPAQYSLTDRRYTIFAYENNMSVTEAGRLHPGASLSSTKEPGSTQHSPLELNNTRREIDDLKAKTD